VVERALDLLIAERMKRRFALVRRPRAKTKRKPSRPDSRHIPHEVRRDAIARDGLQCSYLSATGKRCEQRGLLELHHEQPYRRGGPATTSNIHVLCRAHNQLLAERDYGRAFVQKRVAEARAQRPAVRSSRESRDELPARRDAIQAGE
jgi:5-methylcytosine-specific restriction endonuclease McrA